jgi:hypothetical protein
MGYKLCKHVWLNYNKDSVEIKFKMKKDSPFIVTQLCPAGCFSDHNKQWLEATK